MLSFMPSSGPMSSHSGASFSTATCVLSTFGLRGFGNREVILLWAEDFAERCFVDLFLRIYV